MISEHFNADLLIEYAKELNNGAVFKRLGYLSEIVLGKDHQLLSLCKKMLTKGKAQLEPTLKGNKLITKWQLFVPDKFLFERKNDNT